MKPFIIIVLMALCIPFAIRAQGTGAGPYVETALANNPMLKSSLRRYEAMKSKSFQEGYLDNPTVGADFRQMVGEKFNPSLASVSVSQMFPWFGTLGAREQAMDNMAEASYQQYLDDRNMVVFEVREVYNEMYVVEKSVNVLNEHLRWLTSLREILTTRYENGMSSLSDVLRIEMEHQMFENRKAAFEEKRESLRVAMEELLDQKLQGPIVFHDTLASGNVSTNMDETLELIKERNPKVKKYDYMRSSWEQSERAAGKMGLPSIMLGATYVFANGGTAMTGPTFDNDMLMVPQIGISIPLYRGKYNAMTAEARQEQDAAISEKQAAINALASDAAAAMEGLRNARREIELHRRLADLSAKTRDITIEEYTNARSGIDDVIQVERDYIDYLLGLEGARAEASTSAARLDYITGK